MDDDFRKQVLDHLSDLSRNQAELSRNQAELSRNQAELSQSVGKLGNGLANLEKRLNARMDAIAQRLDDQDMAHDVLVGKVDRLAMNTSAALEAAEQALNRTTALGRRVSRLEQPDRNDE